MAESYNKEIVSYTDDATELVMEETRPLDIVASWETLCSVYRVLEFSDDISDTVRLEEFKWIIREMNKHLTRARKKLLSCQNMDAMKDALMEMYSPAGAVTITSRRDLAYHKLRQRWISQMNIQLEMKMDKEDQDGNPAN